VGSTSEGASNLFGNQGSGSSEPMGMVARINRDREHRLEQLNKKIRRLRQGSGGSAGMGMAMMSSKRGKSLMSEREALMKPDAYSLGLYEDGPHGRQRSQRGLDTGFTGDFDKWERSQARKQSNLQYKKANQKREAKTQARIDSYYPSSQHLAPPPDQSGFF